MLREKKKGKILKIKAKHEIELEASEGIKNTGRGTVSIKGVDVILVTLYLID